MPFLTELLFMHRWTSDARFELMQGGCTSGSRGVWGDGLFRMESDVAVELRGMAKDETAERVSYFVA